MSLFQNKNALFIYFKFILKPLLPFAFKVFPSLRSINLYRNIHGRFPNLIKPKTFNEKLLHKMLFDRDPKLTLFADKWLVRDFVESRLGNGYLSQIYAVVDDSAKIDDLILPCQFVMKPTHLSGRIKIVRDINGLEKGELEKLAREWLQISHYKTLNEWAYKNIKPRVIFEEFLRINDSNSIPDDYKFFCFDGIPKYLQFDRGRYTDHRRNFYDMNFSLLTLNDGKRNLQYKVTKPDNFDDMIEVAKKLSKGSDFVRVDLYNIGGRIVFGELTNYPGTALNKYEPSSWDIVFGECWKL